MPPDISRYDHIFLSQNLRRELSSRLRRADGYYDLLKSKGWVMSTATRAQWFEGAILLGVDLEDAARKVAAADEKERAAIDRFKNRSKNPRRGNARTLEAHALLHKLGYRWVEAAHEWQKNPEW